MSFWETFFLLLIWIPLVLIWATALFDIFRRDDLGGWSKALWVVAVILVPFLGTLIYLIARPAGATAQERQAIDAASRDFVQRYTPTNNAQQLALLADLRERGVLNESEFAAEKQRVLTSANAAH
ncbi:MAG TPA: PLD nuclease N-terminal domain-containing protein [Pseudonocardiaceae bacterium]